MTPAASVALLLLAAAVVAGETVSVRCYSGIANATYTFQYTLFPNEPFFFPVDCETGIENCQIETAQAGSYYILGCGDKEVRGNDDCGWFSEGQRRCYCNGDFCNSATWIQQLLNSTDLPVNGSPGTHSRGAFGYVMGALLALLSYILLVI